MAISNKQFKGTKGEWKVSEIKTYGRQMVDLGDFKGSMDVWYHNGDSMTKEEAEANATLIAAAPEMLAELRKVRLDIKLSNCFREDSPIVQGLDYVINKAIL